MVTIGVDVGTGSARAGIFDMDGRLLGSARHSLSIWREPGEIVEQSSDQVWDAVGQAVRDAMAASAVHNSQVGGIGFDATCSLVVVDPDGKPLPVGPSERAERNIIVWMDHRATEQARQINETKHPVLNYVGNAISPEMETPKLLWLLQHKPEVFAAAEHFFDLSDFLTWRATGSLARSVCTVTCKWTYLAHEARWDADYFHTIGLGVLANEGFARIGTKIVDAATPLGQGLTPEAAADLGLRPGTPVGAALIDAHAGGVGTVGAAMFEGGTADARKRMAYIYGTSACAMATTDAPCFVPGVWGPYFSAMLPGLWLNEGGQSAAGVALDHLLTLHPAHSSAVDAAGQDGIPLLVWLERLTVKDREAVGEVVRLATRLHVVPEFLGNRAPFSDPEARAVISGLPLDPSLDGLLQLYVAGLCGLAYGARQIADALKDKGIPLEQIVVSGGAAQSELVRRILADGTGLEVATATTPEPVLLGSAMLGAVAGGLYPSVAAAMAGMSRLGDTYKPATGPLRRFHDAKFRVYAALQDVDRQSRAFMTDAAI